MGLTTHYQQLRWGQSRAEQSVYEATSPIPRHHSPQVLSQGLPMDYQPLVHGQNHDLGHLTQWCNLCGSLACDYSSRWGWLQCLQVNSANCAPLVRATWATAIQHCKERAGHTCVSQFWTAAQTDASASEFLPCTKSKWEAPIWLPSCFALN